MKPRYVPAKPKVYVFFYVLFFCALSIVSHSEVKMWKGEAFKKPTEQELKKNLKPLQFNVTQKEDTEPPFKNEYWDNKRQGLYVDVVSGEPLFSSEDKYDSGTGWPSFTKPITDEFIKTKIDKHLFYNRTEVRSKLADSHLGHVFDDGPKPTGKRYCMNSASMRFIPVEELEASGYGNFLSHFPGSKADTNQKIVLAGGCFWCMESAFDGLPGVLKVTSGYSGGQKKNPTYKEVSSGSTGHIEVIEVKYDKEKISLKKILENFWKNIDPLDNEGQFCDRGSQYRPAIFYNSNEEKEAAEKSKIDAEKKLKVKGKINTEILSASEFFPAEDYHQEYHKKNPLKYKYYRFSCGRDKRLKAVWGSTPDLCGDGAICD